MFRAETNEISQCLVKSDLVLNKNNDTFIAVILIITVCIYILCNSNVFSNRTLDCSDDKTRILFL